ncbi:MAG: glycosyltransferase [Deltaproteobacteria bacterium]|nr:glycosyltransferase [Deltaproteobacteria bacterium]
MKIGLQTWGTEGDIRPFIALAAGLRRAGHDVTLAVTEIRNKNFSEFSDMLDIPIQHIGHIDCDDAMFKKIASGIFSTLDPVKKGKKLLENFFYPVAESMLKAAKELCLENDLVIGHFFCLSAQDSGKAKQLSHYQCVHRSPVTVPIYAVSGVSFFPKTDKYNLVENG